MKAAVLSILFTLTAVTAHATSVKKPTLDADTAKAMLKERNDAMGSTGKFEVGSIQETATYKGATLYRVTAKYRKGVQSYQVRYPAVGNLTDVLVTESVTHDESFAEEYKTTVQNLAIMTQVAAEATYEHVAKEFPDMKQNGIFIFPNGERFKPGSEAVIFTVQTDYVGAPVMLLRRAYVTRDTYKTEVGYDD